MVWKGLSAPPWTFPGPVGAASWGLGAAADDYDDDVADDYDDDDDGNYIDDVGRGGRVIIIAVLSS